jgi:tyrosine aminotransferase
LEHLEELMLEHGDRVREFSLIIPLILLGAVFLLKDHLQDLVRFCDRHRLPIVMRWKSIGSDPMSFILCSSLPRWSQVPVIAASGVGKRYLVPGWRVRVGCLS